jgi:glycosyltransferase involved in cell wall biosynthesis
MKLRVLMFGWEFPPHNSGGLGTACYGLTKALSRAHIDVVFVLPKKLSGFDHSFLRMVFANIRNVTIRSVHSLLTPYINTESYNEYLRTAPDNELYGLNLFDEVRRYGLQARRIAEEEDFDVIHAHDWLSFRAGIEAKKISGRPLVVHVHATEFDRTAGHPNQMIYDEERKGMHAADCIMAVSHHTKRAIIEHYGIDPEKVIVVHNGIDHRDHQKALSPALEHLRLAGKKVVLFVGRITIQKGPDYFLQAAKRVIQYEPDALFVVSGSGDMEHQMIRMAATMGLSDKVVFAGFVRGDDLLRLYRAAELYVMPSVSEPFGLTALEAVANGTPILVSKQSGVSEVLTNALKSDFWDVEDMADKIIGVLRSGGLKRTLGENGVRDVEQVTWEKAAGKCSVVYQDMLERASLR